VGDGGGALPLRWVSYSRPGNDPTKRVKENQDAAIVHPAFGGREDTMFIGVFDGHGPHGAAASGFIRERLPAIASQPKSSLGEDPFAALHDACINSNAELHNSNIDA
jgi:serine/threonine protein phosphatase PrpC